MSKLPSERDVVFFREQGYFVLRQIVPPALITDLRRMAEEAKTIARREGGPQAQRLQPLVGREGLEAAPLRAFVELPELRAALQTLLTPRHEVSPLDMFGILFEPADRCWATEWHRDWHDHLGAEQFAKVFAEGWEKLAGDLNLFNQFNCALYEDTATWYVPGSHRRLTNTPEETRAAKAADRAAVENQKHERSEAEQEVFLINYCTGMPGAVPLHLNAGDLAIYRNVGWHIGNYVPYRKRATLHGGVITPEYEVFIKRSKVLMAK